MSRSLSFLPLCLCVLRGILTMACCLWSRSSKPQSCGSGNFVSLLISQSLIALPCTVWQMTLYCAARPGSRDPLREHTHLFRTYHREWCELRKYRYEYQTWAKQGGRVLSMPSHSLVPMPSHSLAPASCFPASFPFLSLILCLLAPSCWSLWPWLMRQIWLLTSRVGN